MTDKERITALEARLAQLEARIAQLERQGYTHPAPPPAFIPYPTPAWPHAPFVGDPPQPPWVVTCGAIWAVDPNSGQVLS